LILYWGRNAYSSDPIEIVHNNTTYEVLCHIDITTPRPNALSHGGIEGPHVVISGFRKKETPETIEKVTNGCFWLSPNDVFSLYVHERDHNQTRAQGIPRTWPQWLINRFTNIIIAKYDEQEKRSLRSNSTDEDVGGFDSIFGVD
jgi:hypothetical protein